MLLIASLFSFSADFVAFLLATAFTQQTREKQPPAATPAGHSASNHKFIEL
jgi:hypothetical protein